MKKIIIKIITIIIAFFLGIVSMSYLYNKGNLDMTAHMAEATLPILYFERNGEYVNQTFGYTAEMDASCLRDSILPLDGERVPAFPGARLAEGDDGRTRRGAHCARVSVRARRGLRAR